MRPSEVIHAGDLVLRRYDVDDAAALHGAIGASVEHLRPWMPWVSAEPQTLYDRRQLISDVFDVGWEAGTDFNYGLFLGSEVVGGCGLHDRLGVTDGLEIGYWVRTGQTGRGVATTAVGALCQAAFRLGEVTHVEIHHDKANRASSRVPAKLGFRFVREREDEVYAPAEVGISCEWRLDRPTGN